MGFYRGPRIVRDGLILALDAGSERSYPGTGTTWYDLSGNSFHHTLINSPTYTSDKEFLLTETQGFTYSSSITSSTLCTVIIFYKTTNVQELWLSTSNNDHYLSASNNNTYYHSNCGTPINYVDLKVASNPYAEGYKDGKYHMWEAKNVDLSSMTWFNWFLYGAAWNLIGTVSKILIYNRSLSSEESSQNFNAHRSRFGL